MHQFANRCFAILIAVCMAFAMTACGDDDNGGLVLNQVEPDCESAEDCGGNTPHCVLEECVECETLEHCPDGEGCVDNECVEDDTACSTTSDCPYSSQVCTEGSCQFVPRQCSNVGEECTPGDPTRSQFSCEDLGRGYQCYEKCSANRICIQGQAGQDFNCGRNQACILDDVTEPVCQPAECEDFFDTEAGCAALEAQKPEELEFGKHCVDIGTGAYVCAGAGQGAEGAHCEETTDCGEGLVCVNEMAQAVASAPMVQPLGADSFCTRACNTDSMCESDESCIGLESGVFEGVGICGDRCEPFGAGGEGCSEDTACVPISSEDGLCYRDSSKERDYYEDCSTNDQCPDNSHCINLGEGAQCLPLCDSTLSTDSQRSATCPSPDDVAYVQLAHYAPDEGDVDVYVDGEMVASLSESEVATGEEGFLHVAVGEPMISIQRAATGLTLFEGTMSFERDDAIFIAAVSDGMEDSVGVISHALPRDEMADDEEGKMRFHHGIENADLVDVVLETDTGDELMVAEELAYGDMTEFTLLSLGASSADYDLVVWPHGEIPEPGDVGTTEENGNGNGNGNGGNGNGNGDPEPDPEPIPEPYLQAEVTISSNDVLTGYGIGTADVDAALYLAENAVAPTQRALGGECVDLNAQGANPEPPVIGSGVCLEACRNSDQWGQGLCSSEGDACQPVGNNMGWCFPVGDAEQGDDCENSDQCSDGLFCDLKGDGTGQCRAYCQPDVQSNDALGCETEEVCVPMDGYDNLGECRLPCDPGSDGTDLACPENQQNCVGSGDTAYCAASGDIGHGEDCGSPTVQNCAPGMVCAKSGETLAEVLVEPFTSLDEGEVATCRSTCEPFLGTQLDSGCPDGYKCSPVTPDGVSRTQGHCVPAMDTQVDSLQACPTDEIGSMCDHNSFCIREQANQCVPEESICLQFCDHPTESGCTGSTSCVEGFQGGPLFGFLGLCR